MALTAGRWLVAAATLLLVSSAPSANRAAPWQYFAFDGDRFVAMDSLGDGIVPLAPSSPPIPPWLSPTGDVVASRLGDVTGDGQSEWIVLVWRAWQDWPIQRWVRAPSPISGFRDAHGLSCSIVVVDPEQGVERWAGSPLPVSLVAMQLGDVDGDGRDEIVALEGDYRDGREGPAHHLVVWSWREFGFGLDWRSQLMSVRELRLLAGTAGGILAIGVR
jgi:hypothetical protein